MNSNATERRWTRQERLASLTHRLANAGRTVRDQSTDLPVPPGTILADLSDLALGRYAAQWKGTTRGDAAVAEIARREDRGTLSPATLDTLGITLPVFAGPVRSHGLYSVTVEYIGHGATIPGLRAGQRYVARFAGEYVGGADAEEMAWILCNAHRRGRDAALSGPLRGVIPPAGV